jgi:hypothetical protein
MTREQAEEIQRHLLDASHATGRAGAALCGLDDDERRALALPMAQISYLCFDLLALIYKQFPELEPPSSEVPTINSELCWDEVTLPSSVTERDLDEMIFAVLKPQWQKMAAVLLGAHEHCEKQAWPIEAEVVAARIQALADDDLIEHQGDLRYWRFSEVRQKP